LPPFFFFSLNPNNNFKTKMLATTLFSTLALVAGVNALPASGPFAGSSNLYAGVARFDSNDLTRRSYSGDGTFYAAGTGNCGKFDQGSAWHAGRPWRAGRNGL